MQHSGEDWNHVKMTLSTAQPMLNASPPELGMLQPVLAVRGAPGGPPMPPGAGFVSPYTNPRHNAGLTNKAWQLRVPPCRNSKSANRDVPTEPNNCVHDA